MELIETEFDMCDDCSIIVESVIYYFEKKYKYKLSSKAFQEIIVLIGELKQLDLFRLVSLKYIFEFLYLERHYKEIGKKSNIKILSGSPIFGFSACYHCFWALSNPSFEEGAGIPCDDCPEIEIICDICGIDITEEQADDYAGLCENCSKMTETAMAFFGKKHKYEFPDGNFKFMRFISYRLKFLNLFKINRLKYIFEFLYLGKHFEEIQNYAKPYKNI